MKLEGPLQPSPTENLKLQEIKPIESVAEITTVSPSPRNKGEANIADRQEADAKKLAELREPRLETANDSVEGVIKKRENLFPQEDKPASRIENRKDEPTEKSIAQKTESTQETELKTFAKIFKKVLLGKMEREKSFIKDKEGIKEVARSIRKTLKKVNVETLEEFAREIGIDCVLRTPLVASTGGGVTDLNDGRKILLYYNFLPWQGRYTLAHEVGHIALGHLTAFDGPRTLKEGLKCEWDAERFASNLTRVPRPIAWISWGVDGLLSNIPKLLNRFRKKSEAKKIVQQLGNDPRIEKEVNEILNSF